MVKISDVEISLDIRTENEKKRPYPQSHWHPSSQMNQQSLELCTESLGSETGCDGFFSAEEFHPYFSPSFSERECFEEKAEEKKQKRRMELTTAKNHCSIGRASPRPRSFPPLLSSAFMQTRSFRRDGHLILKAVSLPSYNYLHAERHSGRLVLSFISRLVEEDDDEDDDDEEEGEEEVQVLDRGTVVEVKVSTKPQLVNGVAAMKVLRSSIVINKFVVGDPPADADESTLAGGAERISLTTAEGVAEARPLFRSKRWSREELLREIRRCSELLRPLFIFEQPCSFATSY